eukprot:CAMPEP_0174333454 /NCGR_PEP_ID=MMETSP0810-20121108/19166_1 /TAXON_ID=73025 ORGANISM="Eutreptiella gymnastica-like, Strain CCMP1594" /NCGR_SAMPLE_ID=MMETSP0810 /ASSEMBLY_ACC=CAM_ASM_000659 /LENGTH=163 /DNA_ID=CAMNT_0015450583 /DNA_START=340 /DNA_END=831 /DNA_ORIENTATION=+
MVPEKVNPLKGSPPLQNTENKKLLGNLHKHEALMDAWAEPSGCKDSITTTLEHHRLEEEDKTMSNSKTGKKTPGSGTGNPAATGRRRPLKCNRYLKPKVARHGPATGPGNGLRQDWAVAQNPFPIAPVRQQPQTCCGCQYPKRATHKPGRLGAWAARLEPRAG